MAIQDFTAGQVLTAAQMDSLQANDYNWTVSTKTASYVLTAADKGTRVVMNSASATTITVNTSLFSAGDTLFIQNIGAGTCTVTAGTATVTSAGPLAIPQWGSGTLYFTSASAAIYFPSAVTATSPGLVLISRTTPTAASTLTFDGVFSSTYKSYMIMLEQVTTSSAGSFMSFNLRYGSTTNTAASWYGGIFGASFAGATFAGTTTNAATSFRISTALDPAGNGSTYSLIVSGVGSASLKPAVITQNAEYANAVVRNGSAILQNDTQTYTGFILTNSAGNLTATVAIYGLA